MIVKDLIEELTKIPGEAEVYIKASNVVWMRVDSVDSLQNGEVSFVAEISVVPANWPLFREGK